MLTLPRIAVPVRLSPFVGDEQDDALPLPLRRRDVVLRPVGADGRCVAKDLRSAQYFELPPQEAFLLQQLDGTRDTDEIFAAFERRFQEPLTDDDFEAFIEVAEASGLLTYEATPPRPTPGATATLPVKPQPSRQRQSPLYFRVKLFDPDPLLRWIEPRIRFVWTGGFFVTSSLAILIAAAVAWGQRDQLVTQFPDVLRWQTWLLAWMVLLASTLCHEFAHGLTCKHFGGEVREIGALLLFFVPCLYCDVSDAWLIPQRRRRVWVTLAGAWCDLILWAGAILIWRLTRQDVLLNYLAWAVLTVCGLRIFFNLNPLLKLDGYYILSDLIGIPNLRQRAMDSFFAHARRLLWGAPRPTNDGADYRRPTLVAFGAAAWAYSTMFLGLMIVGFAWLFHEWWGDAGAVLAVVIGGWLMKDLLSGLLSGLEVRQMLRHRLNRTALWAAGLALGAVALAVVPVQERAGGQFRLRAVARQEVRAPVAGFLRAVERDEGQPIECGQELARLEQPDLAMRLARKRAEAAQTSARIKLARAGGGVAPDAPSAAPDVRDAEIEAQRAQLAGLTEEVKYLESVQTKLLVRAGVSGTVVTPHLRDRIGEFFQEGELICVIEDAAQLEAELLLSEQDVRHVRTGQHVEIRSRAAPLTALYGVVRRVAPVASAPPNPLNPNVPIQAPAPPPTENSVAVYCSIERDAGASASASGNANENATDTTDAASLRPGMTGYARIDCGRVTVGRLLLEKAMQAVRTEFW